MTACTCARCGDLAEPEEECPSCGFDPKTDEPLVMRPLRRLGPGRWQSRDGFWTFTGPADLFNQATSNEIFWHIHMKGLGEAWGEREPTLRDAVAAVEDDFAGKGFGRTPDEKVLALVEAHGRRWRNKRSEQSTMVRSVIGGNVYVSDVATGRSRSLPSASFLRLYESEDARG